MPIYEFECKACGHTFSKLYRKVRASDEDTPPPCPKCGSDDTKRTVTSFAVHGPSAPDIQEVAAQQQEAERLGSITPKSQIEKWRRGQD